MPETVGYPAAAVAAAGTTPTLPATPYPALGGVARCGSGTGNMTRKILLGPTGEVKNVLVVGDGYEIPNGHDLRESAPGVSPGDAWDGSVWVDRPGPGYEWTGSEFVEASA